MMLYIYIYIYIYIYLHTCIHMFICSGMICRWYDMQMMLYICKILAYQHTNPSSPLQPSAPHSSHQAFSSLPHPCAYCKCYHFDPQKVNSRTNGHTSEFKDKRTSYHIRTLNKNHWNHNFPWGEIWPSPYSEHRTFSPWPQGQTDIIHVYIHLK